METNKTPVLVQIGGRVFKALADATWANAPVDALNLLVGEDKQSVELKLESLDSKEKDRMADELLMQGLCTKTVYLGNKRLPVVFEVFDTGSALANDTLLDGLAVPTGAMRDWDQDYLTIRVLARGIKSFDGIELPKERSKREEFIMKKPFPIRDRLWILWRQFVFEMEQCLVPDYLEARVGNS